jgi:hypothetical protein
MSAGSSGISLVSFEKINMMKNVIFICSYRRPTNTNFEPSCLKFSVKYAKPSKYEYILMVKPSKY